MGWLALMPVFFPLSLMLMLTPVLEHLPLVQCASLFKTIDDGPIVFIVSQYAHKPDTKTIHSNSQKEYFSCLIYDSALTAGKHQSIITHEGYVIPLHV